MSWRYLLASMGSSFRPTDTMYSDSTVDSLERRLCEDGCVVLVGIFAKELSLLADQVAQGWSGPVVRADASEVAAGDFETAAHTLYVLESWALNMSGRRDLPNKVGSQDAGPSRLDLADRDGSFLVLTNASQSWPVMWMTGALSPGGRADREAPADNEARPSFGGHPVLEQVCRRHDQAWTPSTWRRMGPAFLDIAGWDGQTAWQHMQQSFEALSRLEASVLWVLALSPTPLSMEAIWLVCDANPAQVSAAGLFLRHCGWVQSAPAADRADTITWTTTELGAFYCELARQKSDTHPAANYLDSYCDALVGEQRVDEQRVDEQQVDEQRASSGSPHWRPFEAAAQLCGLAGRLTELGELNSAAIAKVETFLTRCFDAQIWQPTRPGSLGGGSLGGGSLAGEGFTRSLHYPSEMVRRIGGPWDGRPPALGDDQHPGPNSGERTPDQSAAPHQLGLPRHWRRAVRLTSRAEQMWPSGNSETTLLLVEQIGEQLQNELPAQVKSRIALRVAAVLANGGLFDESKQWMSRARAWSTPALCAQWHFELERLAVAVALLDGERALSGHSKRLMRWAVDTDDRGRIDVALALSELAQQRLARRSTTSVSGHAERLLGDRPCRFPAVGAMLAFLQAAERDGPQMARKVVDVLQRDVASSDQVWKLQLNFVGLLLDTLQEGDDAQHALCVWLDEHHLVEWLGSGGAERIRLPPFARYLWDRYGDDSWLLNADDSSEMAGERSRHITVHPHGYWFRTHDGHLVDLTGRTALRRLFRHFVEEHRRGERAGAGADALIEVGWPRQTLDIEAARGRVYTAIRQLRDLGLRDLLVTRQSGYALGRHAVVHMRDLTAESARHHLSD